MTRPQHSPTVLSRGVMEGWLSIATRTAFWPPGHLSLLALYHSCTVEPANFLAQSREWSQTCLQLSQDSLRQVCAATLRLRALQPPQIPNGPSLVQHMTLTALPETSKKPRPLGLVVMPFSCVLLFCLGTLPLPCCCFCTLPHCLPLLLACPARWRCSVDDHVR